MKYTPLNKSLYIKNRKKFAEKLKPNSVAIFHANDLMPRNADAQYKFKQNSDLFYLSGIDQEETILIINPDHPNEAMREILFLRQTNEDIAIWEGHKYTMEEAREASGIQTIFWNDQFDAQLQLIMNHTENCYISLNEHDRFHTEVPYKNLRFSNEMKAQYPMHAFERAAPIMHDLRSTKEHEEVDQIQEACNITDKAFRRVLDFVKPGVTEYEIEAEITHEFLKNRATGHAYDPIIASGYSACVLHYITNNAVCNDGEVILFDFGAEYGNYCADLSRAIPVNGKFTDRQKAVYNTVLKVFREACKLLTPGTLLDDYHKEVGNIMTSGLIDLGLLDKEDVKNQDPQNPLYKKYFMHGTSHHLGLDVHDVGDKYQTMRVGNVFTCEPGIYIREENLGIRIENDILITDNGQKDLMANIPIEVEEVEGLMNSK